MSNLKRQTTYGIVMPAYNAEEFISEAIESVIAQTVEDWQLVVVDDGSTDKTFEIAERYASDERITVITQENAGAPAAKNAGFKMLNTEWFTYFDSDDILEPDYLEQMAKIIEMHPANDYYSCNCTCFWPDGTEKIYRTWQEPTEITLEMMLRRNEMVGAGTLQLSSNFAARGCFPENDRYAEDYLFWLRALADGQKVVAVDASLLRYRQHTDTDSACTDVRSMIAPLRLLMEISELAGLVPAELGAAQEGIECYAKKVAWKLSGASRRDFIALQRETFLTPKVLECVRKRAGFIVPLKHRIALKIFG